VTGWNKSIGSERDHSTKGLDVPMKRSKPERIVILLRAIEVEIAV